MARPREIPLRLLIYGLILPLIAGAVGACGKKSDRASQESGAPEIARATVSAKAEGDADDHKPAPSSREVAPPPAGGGRSDGAARSGFLRPRSERKDGPDVGFPGAGGAR